MVHITIVIDHSSSLLLISVQESISISSYIFNGDFLFFFASFLKSRSLNSYGKADRQVGHSSFYFTHLNRQAS